MLKYNTWFSKKHWGSNTPTMQFAFQQDFVEKHTNASRADWVPVYSDRGRLAINFNLFFPKPVNNVATQLYLDQQLKELFGARKTADKKEYFSIVSETGGSKVKKGWSCVNVQWYCLCPMPSDEQMLKFREIVENSIIPALFVCVNAKTGEMEVYEFEELPEDYNTRRNIIRMCRGEKFRYAEKECIKRPTIAGGWWSFYKEKY